MGFVVPATELAAQPAAQLALVLAAELAATPTACTPRAAKLAAQPDAALVHDCKATLLLRTENGAKPSLLLHNGLLRSGLRFGTGLLLRLRIELVAVLDLRPAQREELVEARLPM